MPLSTLTRNQLIERAFRKCRVLGVGETMSSDQLADGILALNLIIREMDMEGTQVWALGTAPTTITLQANIGIYTSSDGLPTDITELTEVTYRSGSGNDTPLTLYDHRAYEQIWNKFQTGDPEAVYLNLNKQPASHQLYIWPLPTNVGTQSEVTGSDALNYSCIRSHTSATTNKPITGDNWRLYWEQTGSSGSAWAVDTQYTAPKLLRLWYKKSLADFSAASDNPDVPPGLVRTLMYRLADDLSIDTGKDAEFERRLNQKWKESEARTFRRAQKEKSTNYHNKAKYF